MQGGILRLLCLIGRTVCDVVDRGGYIVRRVCRGLCRRGQLLARCRDGLRGSVDFADHLAQGIRHAAQLMGDRADLVRAFEELVDACIVLCTQIETGEVRDHSGECADRVCNPFVNEEGEQCDEQDRAQDREADADENHVFCLADEDIIIGYRHDCPLRIDPFEVER